MAGRNAHPIADQRIPVDLGTVFELRRHTFAVLSQPHAFRAEMNRAGRNFRAQGAEQFGAMNHHGHVAEAALKRDAFHLHQHPPVPAAQSTRCLADAQRPDTVSQAEVSQRLQSVRPQRQARADLPQLRSAFEHYRLQPRPAQRNCGSESADAGADHDHLLFQFHICNRRPAGNSPR
jgi:hypothetical protein